MINGGGEGRKRVVEAKSVLSAISETTRHISSRAQATPSPSDRNAKKSLDSLQYEREQHLAEYGQVEEGTRAEERN